MIETLGGLFLLVRAPIQSVGIAVHVGQGF
jgi:hypothetical protein